MSAKLRVKAQVLDPEGIQRALGRMAHEILEHHGDPDRIALIGIRSRGDQLAARLAQQIQKIGEMGTRTVKMGVLDITLYRDDLQLQAANPVIHATEVPFDVTGLSIIVVDDVLFTGRTIRAAMDALADLGRPRLIELAVLVDRGHRELPIKANYVGKNVPTMREDVVRVKLTESDGTDEVLIEERVANALDT